MTAITIVELGAEFCEKEEAYYKAKQLPESPEKRVNVKTAEKHLHLAKAAMLKKQRDLLVEDLASFNLEIQCIEEYVEICDMVIKNPHSKSYKDVDELNKRTALTHLKEMEAQGRLLMKEATDRQLQVVFQLLKARRARYIPKAIAGVEKSKQ